MFEGTPPQFLASLRALAALPDDTAVYCAHGGSGPLPAGYSSTVATLLPHPVPLRRLEEVPVVRDTPWSGPLPADVTAECDSSGFCGQGQVGSSAAAYARVDVEEDWRLVVRPTIVRGL
jgi:hydroxyacylglutathione hydrolase